MTGLRTKHRVFIEEYLRCWNASEAARRAGYKTRPNTAGQRLMSNADIRAEIERRLAEVCMGADEVLVRLAEQARAEYSAYLRADGTVDLERMLADGKGHLVRSTKWDRNDNLTVEFYDAHAALVDIGKHLRLFNDNLALNINLSKLNDDQLERIANGEDPLAVIAAPGASRAGAAQAGGEAEGGPAIS